VCASQSEFFVVCVFLNLQQKSCSPIAKKPLSNSGLGSGPPGFQPTGPFKQLLVRFAVSGTFPSPTNSLRHPPKPQRTQKGQPKKNRCSSLAFCILPSIHPPKISHGLTTRISPETAYARFLRGSVDPIFLRAFGFLRRRFPSPRRLWSKPNRAVGWLTLPLPSGLELGEDGEPRRRAGRWIRRHGRRGM
jgi:hypothetical protein